MTTMTSTMSVKALRSYELQKDNDKLAKEIAAWKESVAERWDSIYVVSKNEDALQDLSTGHKVKVSYTIDEQGLNNAIGLELVFLNNAPVDDVNIHKVIPFKLVKTEGNNYTFEATLKPVRLVAYKWAVRMFPKNDLLPHRQDFAYVKWIGSKTV